MAKTLIRTHRELDVYRMSLDLAMKIFELTKSFPSEERYSLTDQMRRSARSVCAHIAEAWRRRRYQAAFVNKLNESEAEAAEVQVWTEIALHCGYISEDIHRDLYDSYDNVIGKLVTMINNPSPWILKH